MKIDVIDESGKVLETLTYADVKLDDNVQNALYLINNYQNHEAWQKTASVKTRSEVRGGGAKPFRQKGTGRARRGTSRTPLTVGGGIIFGPKPVKKKMKLNQSFYSSSMRKILLSGVAEIKLLKTKDDLKTKDVRDLTADSFVLVSDDDLLCRAFNNFKNGTVVSSKNILVRKLIGSKVYIDYKVKDIIDG